MKLKDYIGILQQILIEYSDLDVIYAVDDEGNNYDFVAWLPSVGFFDGEEFVEERDLDSATKSNVVCIN